MMVNDTSTLNGALQELGETMADNLTTMGVTASASEGLTTLAGKILDIQGGGGSCCKIEFSESEYAATGGSATLEIYLQENYAPKSGATVSVTGSDSSSYTGITGNDGIATVTVSGLSATATFTAFYSNVSATCTVTVQTAWIDPCTSNENLGGYGSYINLRDTTTQTAYLQYDSTENSYVLYGLNNGGKQNLIPCSYLDGADDFHFEAEVKIKSSNAYYQFGIGLTSTDSKTTSYNYRIRGDSKIQRYNITNGTESETTKVSETTANKWWKLSMVKQGTTLTTTITDVANDTVKATDTQTITSRSNQRVGLFLLAYGTSYKGYFRNITAEIL